MTREQVNAELKGTGLFFPIDPGANATIGGMASTRASGTNAVRYGTMRENVLGLTVVTADGRIVRTGGRARKSIGRLRPHASLRRQPKARSASSPRSSCASTACPRRSPPRSASFPISKAAVHTVIVAMQMGIPVARIELLDALQMDACIRYSKLEGFEAKPTLLFEFHGTESRRARAGRD